MAVTEKQAAGKWCPQVIRAGDRGNRGADGGRPGGMCLGSQCMWWRWLYPPDRNGPLGFCGAAGKP